MMTERAAALSDFLTLSGWGDATSAPLAGDASNRRYERLTHPLLGRAVLMDAPPQKGEDVRPFITIALHLRSLGLSSPEIFARDVQHGFLLIEDLGDDLFARVLERDLSLETPLYLAAIDALITAQSAPPPKGLASYDTDAMTETALLAVDWYQRYATGTVNETLRADLACVVEATLTQYMTGPPVLVQRDYHAENLLWLPDRSGTARTGLLDFQDAMLGHPAYDLASLLKDARRDVGFETQETSLAHYLDQTGREPETFMAAYSAVSAQRNLRILGVFARLSIRDGKRNYPDLIPRVWSNLQSDLAHPALADLKALIEAQITPPTDAIIATLKSAEPANA
jgi:aminoglycoside/choline kinase family phosphotransferase